MPCTPTGLSYSYISRWADLTIPSSLDHMPSLDPIPSPARGRGRTRRGRKDENESDEPCRRSQATCSPHPPVTRVAPCNSRTRVMATRRPAVLPNPTLSFRRLAHQKQPPTTQIIPRVPSDVTNKPTTSTPSPDLIFTMSPVLGLDALTRRRPSHLSAELDIPTPSPRSSWDQPPPPYSTSNATTSAVFADESSASVIDDLVAESMIVPMRLHAKSDPLPARLSSVTSTSLDTTPARPIPIPKPSPRGPSDYGGVSSVSVSVSLPRFTRTRKAKQDENVPVPLSVVEEPADVTGEWCGTADAVPVAITQRAPQRKKRFFIGVGESYDGDMDSEWSSWR
ncbi:unnamed protein product [Rhizoctonia solani]|uniref:Uncharacterized protein n=1 Tax=Rhizoctonia solani TaxID=456999 RepID=A0A8H3DNE0_9AGAM|nr:unnamed protein product [Rhizoctonia solani]